MGYRQWDFSPPLCSPDGTCHESSTEPTPRTRFSAKSLTQYREWWRAHDGFRVYAERAVRPDLLLIGDSITESYANSSFFLRCARCKGVPEALATEMAGAFREPLVIAISGDQTQHVLWRLAHGGGLPPRLRGSGTVVNRTVVNLLIGTNNLGAGHLPADAALGVRAVAAWLLHNTGASVLVNKLLPRSDTRPLALLCPPRCSSPGVPFATFKQAIAKANALIEQHTSGLAQQFPGRVALADCGPVLTDARGEANIALMPDRLHPNALGHALLLRCLRPQLLALHRPREQPRR